MPERMSLTESVSVLSDQNIAFGVHFTSTKPEEPETKGWIITIKESLNNDQLQAAVNLGGLLERDGIVHIIGRGI